MKVFKKVIATVSALAIASAMSVTAFAATADELVAAAANYGFTDKYTTELKNYLDANGSQYTAEDFDTMISSIKECSKTYLIPMVEEMYGAGTEISSLSQAELIKVFKSLDTADKDAILAAAKSTAADFGLVLSTETLDSGYVNIYVSDENGNVLIGSPVKNQAIQTGVETNTVNVQLIAAVVLALAVVGIVVCTKTTKKTGATL